MSSSVMTPVDIPPSGGQHGDRFTTDVIGNLSQTVTRCCFGVGTARTTADSPCRPGAVHLLPLPGLQGGSAWAGATVTWELGMSCLAAHTFHFPVAILRAVNGKL